LESNKFKYKLVTNIYIYPDSKKNKEEKLNLIKNISIKLPKAIWKYYKHYLPLPKTKEKKLLRNIRLTLKEIKKLIYKRWKKAEKSRRLEFNILILKEYII